MLDGKHSFAGVLRDAKRPMVIVGAAAAARPDGAAVLAAAAKIALLAGEGKDAGWNAFNVLHTAASRVAGLDLGFVPGSKGGIDMGALDVVYLLGADELDMKALRAPFVIYQGSHGDAGAERADVVLPGAAYTEKSATYVNIEGRAQLTARAAFAPGEAKEDWAIVRALSAHVGTDAPLRHASRAARGHVQGRARAGAARCGGAGRHGKGVEALAGTRRRAGVGAVRLGGARLLPDQSDCARLAVMAELSALKKSMDRGTTGTHG